MEGTQFSLCLGLGILVSKQPRLPVCCYELLAPFQTDLSMLSNQFVYSGQFFLESGSSRTSHVNHDIKLHRELYRLCCYDGSQEGKNTSVTKVV